MKLNLFRKSIAGITKQFNSMVAELQQLAEAHRAEVESIHSVAADLELAANVRHRRELDKVDALYDEAEVLRKEAHDAEKLAAKIAKTFSI